VGDETISEAIKDSSIRANDAQPSFYIFNCMVDQQSNSHCDSSLSSVRHMLVICQISAFDFSGSSAIKIT